MPIRTKNMYDNHGNGAGPLNIEKMVDPHLLCSCLGTTEPSAPGVVAAAAPIHDKFSYLKKDLSVAICLCKDKKKVDYRGVLTKDLERNKDNSPRTLEVKITHARNARDEKKIITFAYSQKESAWMVAIGKFEKCGTTRIKKDPTRQYLIKTEAA